MYETAYGTSSKYVLLLDDDVVVEPEGILRAVTFADLCRAPTIVGGHMFNMHVRSVLHAFGETRQPATGSSGDRHPTRATPTTSRRVRCARLDGCTAASTSTTTAGGCA